MGAFGPLALFIIFSLISILMAGAALELLVLLSAREGTTSLAFGGKKGGVQFALPVIASVSVEALDAFLGAVALGDAGSYVRFYEEAGGIMSPRAKFIAEQDYKRDGLAGVDDQAWREPDLT